MTIKRRLMVTLGAMAIPAAGAAGQPIKVPTLPGMEVEHPCDSPTYGLREYVWRGDKGRCREAVDTGAKVMWRPADAPVGS